MQKNGWGLKEMSLVLSLMIPLCSCKKPKPYITQVKVKCPICGKRKKFYLGVRCKKCGNLILGRQKPKSKWCQHSDKEWEDWFNK